MYYSGKDLVERKERVSELTKKQMRIKKIFKEAHEPETETFFVCKEHGEIKPKTVTL